MSVTFERMRRLASVFLLALFVGCASRGKADLDDDPVPTGGAAGDSGTSGEAGTGGDAGEPGSGGDAGTAGASGNDAAGGPGTGGSGDAGAAGTSTAGSSAGGAAGSAPSPACEGVSCNNPPDKVCANADELSIYTAPGSCNDGACNYIASKVKCDKGCKDDACVGNPCIGVSCNTPPAATCVGPQQLLAHDVPGTCKGETGACAYADKNIFCQFGCEKGACKGNPCSSTICAAPPANYCSAADKLTVFASTGTCDGATGNCSYEKHEEFCSFGCAAGSCKNDPCAGVSCTTPPAAMCTGPLSRSVPVVPGTCDKGACAYAATTQDCPFGCVNGVCKECATDPDCGGGKYCDAGTCRGCDNDTRCGSTCANCALDNKVCSDGACVTCTKDAQCGPGATCEGGTCKACTTDQKCGPSCNACSGTTPTCAGGTTCSCTPTSCGAYNQCVGAACQACNTNAACGSDCAPCGGSTPVCKVTGATSTCVECNTTADCGSGKTCTPDNRCVAGCPPPADSCDPGTQSRDKCTNARIIGRKQASGGVILSGNTCSASNRSDESSSVSNCFDAGGDHHFRVYMRKGEFVYAKIAAGESCPSYPDAHWDSTLKIYATSTCNNGVASPFSGCGTRAFCDDFFNGKSTTYTATEDGWVVIVMDGATAFDDEGDYQLTVKLTCADSSCECP
jgi:hypothetical protein